MNFSRISRQAETLAPWVVVALGISLPISTALDNVLLFVILILWVASAEYKTRIVLALKNPVALAAVAIFLLYVLGLLYGDAEKADALKSLSKASNFLLIALFIPLLQNEKTRRWAINAFLCAMSITLVISYLKWFDVLPQSGFIKGSPQDPTVFKAHITQNLLMAYATYFFAVHARIVTTRNTRLIYIALFGLGLFNVLFMVQGRTGQFALIVLLGYFLVKWLRWKSIFAILAMLALIGGLAYLFSSSAIHQRTVQMLSEYSAWNSHESSTTSTGQRLEFYKHAVTIIRDRPLVGVGTGGFRKAYAKQVENTAMTPTNNPHNEYIMVTTQLGFVGLFALLTLFYLQWRLARQLSTVDELRAKGLLISIVCASFFNSTLMDHTEGLFYVWMSAVLYATLPPLHTHKYRA